MKSTTVTYIKNRINDISDTKTNELTKKRDEIMESITREIASAWGKRLQPESPEKIKQMGIARLSGERRYSYHSSPEIVDLFKNYKEVESCFINERTAATDAIVNKYSLVGKQIRSDTTLLLDKLLLGKDQEEVLSMLTAFANKKYAVA